MDGVWVNSGSWWWTGRPGVLRFMGSQRVGHDWATELNWNEWIRNQEIYRGKSRYSQNGNRGPNYGNCWTSRALTFILDEIQSYWKYLEQYSDILSGSLWLSWMSRSKIGGRSVRKRLWLSRCRGLGGSGTRWWPWGERKWFWCGYILNVELIGFPGRLHVSWYLTERSSRRQAGAEERRTEMRKVMEILCHSKASAKNTRDRGHCNLTGHETGKTKDPVRWLKQKRPFSYVSRCPIPDGMPETRHWWYNLSGSGNKSSPWGHLWKGAWLRHYSGLRMPSTSIVKHQNTKLLFPGLRIF